ncbi:uncharacterized protein LOC121529668 [Drosophila eugracilis]|uniref:uncharacterized protein LOC121529668 n=1 Tax=Drosophila eugracilis TaxID=29029 RepID=UPI001BDA71AE|nr:uncharacterized protein LOC121529668 [Drosophila eugracilis]
MQSRIFIMLLLIAVCRSEDDFIRIGDGFYYIGNEKDTGHYFDWFVARQDCWRRVSTLVSVETSDELSQLEETIVSRGFPEGSTFATSGHNFESTYPYVWHEMNTPLNFTRWLPGTEPDVEKTYLSLVLVNSSLYMRRSSGIDDYYICEYNFTPWQYWVSFETQTRTVITLICCFLLLVQLLLFFKFIRRMKSMPNKGDKLLNQHPIPDESKTYNFNNNPLEYKYIIKV